MKSFIHSVLGNAIGTPGIQLGKGLIVSGNVVAKGGQNLVESSTKFRDNQLTKAENARIEEQAKREADEAKRHAEALAAIEKAKQDELQRHEKATAPEEVPPGELATAAA